MTQEELLAKINKGGVESLQSDSLGWLPLRAVVELHRPMLWKNLGNDTDGYKCQACQGWTRDLYPCPTIQAIEKELAL